jgi:hypothetical protein
VFPRGEREEPFVGKPDFDGRAFYRQKQGKALNKSNTMKGYTFKDSACHISEDPSKKTFPGPAFYNEARSFLKTTSHLPTPQYSVPTAGSMDMEKIKRYFK